MELKERIEYLEKKNRELVLENKKKSERLKELEITVKVLRRFNSEEEQNG